VYKRKGSLCFFIFRIEVLLYDSRIGYIWQVLCRNLRALLLELIAISRATRGKEAFPIDLAPTGDDFDSSL
jgi:hypothetical protein